MLFTLTTTHRPATDLGFLLKKNPARAQAFELPFGTAHVFYPEATDERCTAALLLEVDPIGLVRGGSHRGPLQPYVNDRPYVASSFFSVALGRVLGTALAGTSAERPELAQAALPLTARLAVVPCREGEPLLRRLFEPLGYQLRVTPHPLVGPGLDEARAFTVELSATTRVSELLTHLYVLVPVLDDDKHYWVGDDEVQKLLRHGEGWLPTHPERELITRRYLKHQRSLTREALAQLSIDEAPEPRATGEESLERTLSLNERRLATVVETLTALGAQRVVDVGCGEGRLLQALLRERSFTGLVGLDVSFRALEAARERLELDRLPELQRRRVRLLHGSLLYRDARLAGFDAATAIEVIEHLDAPRLATFERVLFEFARPAAVLVTTPNVEFNARFERLPKGQLRHPDHRFEWSRAEFRAWAERVAARFGYQVRFAGIGDEDSTLGPPTQLGVFTR